MSKQQLGQFYTTEAEFILQGLDDIFSSQKEQEFIDPFAGQGDLIDFLKSKHFVKVKGYDIEPKRDDIVQNDSLLNPLNYIGKYIITNPPFLAKNKSKDKTYFEQYGVQDLYLASLKTIMNAQGGIVILPTSFFTNNNTKARKEFLEEFVIHRINFFQKPVFKDTTYTVCAFNFTKGSGVGRTIECVFFPSEKKSAIVFNSENNYTFGDKLLIQKPKTQVSRLLIGQEPNSRIKLFAIDTSERIKLAIDEPYYGKSTDRAFATLVFDRDVAEFEQEIVIRFNQKINEMRDQYDSMFLTNYRNNDRKRIGFKQVYTLVGHIVDDLLKNE